MKLMKMAVPARKVAIVRDFLSTMKDISNRPVKDEKKLVPRFGSNGVKDVIVNERCVIVKMDDGMMHVIQYTDLETMNDRDLDAIRSAVKNSMHDSM